MVPSVRRWALLLLGALWVPATEAQQAFRVKDIRPGTDDSRPQAFSRVGSAVYFVASTQFFNTTLWKTDGTAAGTVLVKQMDISAPQSLPVGVDFGGRLFFSGSVSGGDTELWASDGTEAGTQLVKDIRPGPAASRPHRLAVAGGRLFFAATTDAAGTELWTSDGTEAGTVLVKDIEAGAGSSEPDYLTPVGGAVYFTASTAAAGQELWRSDGTTAGTVLVADLAPGSAGSLPRDLVDLSGTLLFATSGVASGALWRSDGTAAGTVPLGEVVGADGLTRVGDVVFFRGSALPFDLEVWKSDGTAAGTVRVADLNPTSTSFPESFVDVGGVAYFTAEVPGIGRELWKSDGTAAGTVLVKDVWPGAQGSEAAGLANLGGQLLFSANDGAGRELWRSDGTPAGTVLVTDVNPGSSAEPGPPFASGGVALFSAIDGSHGQELWASDGTAGGTSLLKDINVQAAGSRPRDLVAVAGRVFFRADDGAHGREIWVSDGTEGGTHLVRDLDPGAGPDPLTFQATKSVASGPNLLFNGNDHVLGSELWKTDGTEAGTTLVKDIAPGLGSSPSELTAGPIVLFRANNLDNGRELWRTDGTGAGTTLAADIVPGAASSQPYEITFVGQRAFMGAGSFGQEELWVWDGAPSGARLVKDIRPGPPGSHPTLLRAAGGLLFFMADDGVHGAELWRSDGTEAGTFMVKDVIPGIGAPGFVELVAADDLAFLKACDTFSPRCDVWRTDGSEGGTVRVFVDTGASFASNLTPLGRGALFVVINGLNQKLQRTDGTEAGTTVLREFAGALPHSLAPAGGGVAFCVNDFTLRIWWTDGTAEGTVPADDTGVCPSPDPPLREAGSLAYFEALGAEGQELWALPRSFLTGLRVGDCAAREGSTGTNTNTCTFTVTLSAPLPDPVTLGYATADGTATAGEDYLAASGSLTFAAGVTSQAVPVVITGDLAIEPNEDFSLQLSGAAGALVIDGQGRGAILDDEAARFYTVPSCRLVDTRGLPAAIGGPALSAGASRTFGVAGRCGVPAEAKAVAVNLTVVNAGAPGNLRAYPAGEAAPTTSVINFVPGRTRANNAVAGLGAGGAVTVQCDMMPGTLANAHLVVDVYGYFR